MKVHIKYFASIRETIGLSAEALETEAPTLAALRDADDDVRAAAADALAQQALEARLEVMAQPYPANAGG